MKFSARNQFTGTIEAVDHGGIISTLRIRVSDEVVITSSITKEAATQLDLTVGDEVTALVKSSDVIVAVDR